jgi:hypothetical protein
VMHGLHAPLRIRIKGHHDQRVAPGTGCDPDIKPLNTHGSSWHGDCRAYAAG